MRRRFILDCFDRYLRDLNAEFPITEVLLDPNRIEEISVFRSMLIEGEQTNEDIINFFDEYCAGDNVLSNAQIQTYESYDDIRDSQLIDPNDTSLTFNWRGRLWKWDDLQGVANQDEFREKVFASYWRFIVTKRNNEYFSRFEISPSFYTPGHSTAGMEDFRKGITNFIEFLESKREINQADLNFDRIVFFSRQEPNRQFGRCNPNFFNGANFLSLNDFLVSIANQGQDEIVNQIHNSITQSFN